MFIEDSPVKLGTVFVTLAGLTAYGCGEEAPNAVACPQLETNPAPFDAAQIGLLTDELRELTARVSGFGGVFLTSTPRGEARGGPTGLTLYLVDPSEARGQAAQRAVAEVVGRPALGDIELQVFPAAYDLIDA